MTAAGPEVVTVNVALETVWDAVNDVALWPSPLDDASTVHLLRQTRDSRELEISVGTGTWVLRQTLDPGPRTTDPAARTTTFGVRDAAASTAGWQRLVLRAVPGGTELRSETEGDPPPLTLPVARLAEQLRDVPAPAPVDDPRAAARGLADQIAASAARHCRAHTLSGGLVAQLRAAGLYTMGLPRSLGGRQSDFRTIVDVVEELSRADGATGWHVLTGNTNAFLAWLDPAVAKGLLAGAPSPALAGSTAPNGRGTRREDGGFRVSGRWPLCSGSTHAGVLMAGFLVDGDPPGPGPLPPARVGFFPAEAATLLGTWRPMGLEATGSHDLELAGLDIPAEATAAPHVEPARHDGELYRLTPYNILMVLLAGFPLGIMRRAVDDATALARTKFRAGSRSPMIDDPETVSTLLDAESALRAARALVHETFDEAWQALAAGDQLSDRQRAAIAMAAGHALRRGREVATAMLRLGGTGALNLDHPLQRCLRDVHAAGQHVGFGDDLRQRVGRTFLGLETSPALHQV
ncbi:Acyl-CoA dehydrogenase [Micromonospora nigra]|uniref:Acyl-CoA dehydrogenase n=1 Tax=Micromonospora nigra TaxID=145857 RepID=A0A1C6T1H9_9ACTN|nr:acyl-CoA dehydrogenase family protein [Micromonospora nigra]SCL35680.1 Acyl-CoA dehydrogenase [Micromonospora nigra]